MSFSVNDVRSQFDQATFARGDSYARSGKVISVRSAAGRLDGEVGGSGDAVYQQKISFKVKGERIDIDGKCSCPVARNCKHVVATLLVSLQQGEAAIEAGLPALADQWAREAAQALQSAPATPGRRPGPRLRLVFALVPHPEDGVPRLQICHGRLRKDDSIASVTGAQPTYSLLAAYNGPLRADDEHAIRLHGALNVGIIENDVAPTGRLGKELLETLAGDGRLQYANSRAELNKGIMRPVRRGPERTAGLGWHAGAADPERLRLRWSFADGGLVDHVFNTAPPLYLADGMLGTLQLTALSPQLPLATLLTMVTQAPPLLPAQRGPMAQRMVEQGLDQVLPLPAADVAQVRRDIVPVPHLLMDSCETAAPTNGWGWRSLDSVVRHDYARLWFDYDGVIAAPLAGSAPAQLRRVNGDRVELIARDRDAELEAAELLEDMGFIRAHSHPSLAEMDGCLEMARPHAWDLFVTQGVPLLEEIGWQITSGKHFSYGHVEVEDWYADLADGEEASSHWFDLELGIVVDGERLALLPLLVDYLRDLPAAVAFADPQSEQNGIDLFAALPDGRRVRLPWPRIQPLLAILREMHFREEFGEGGRLPFTSAARLAELEAAAQLRWMGGETLRALGRKLHDFNGIAEATVPAGLQAQLRPYQRAGLSWLQFLREYNFGGILADDMGLGKTVQTLAHILAEKEAGRLDRPALVVAPTSLMGNWQSEAARFAPGLRVLLLHGKERTAQFDAIAHADLVLTTYALLSRDEQALRQHRYHLLILDEAQYIKNSRAKAAQTACLLDARHRLCLTGTPVQNHLGELWSQFHFLMPGLLGDLKTFNATLRRPIEQQGDSGSQALLNARIKPFMLRRTKDKVATELPPKTEILLPVELDSAQRDLYETVRVAMDKKVKQEIDRRGLARSHIVILDALLKLRQVCCDPRLLKKPASTAGSAKMDTLLDLLDTLLSEGRKVLIFSQFTSMLALIGDALRARAVDYALLQGDTLDRAAPIAAFQQGKVSVFLISLKAGGVGLNLTAADTVIHYDPWWNPASESQATDRAWRIGQTQPVFVYKLIARGTVEEKIQEMQKRKGDLASAVLDAEGGLADHIGAADLQAILSQ